MKKLLYVNGKFLAQPVTGVQRYALGVITAWDKALDSGRIDSSQFAIKILAPSDSRFPAWLKNVEVEIASSLKGRIWEQIYLPFRSRGALLFSPYAAAPMFKRRHAVTIHDSGFAATPQQYSRRCRLYYKLVYRIIGKTALQIFTVSEFSKRELHAYFSIPVQKMIVARPGYEPILAANSECGILETHGLVSGKFILGVSSRSPIKNFDTLIKAWKSLASSDTPLVIAGGYNSKVFGKRRLDNPDGVLFLGYVSDGELRALYENAACFVYPSLYEGFGLPPVEAMACGCPVIVSTCSALPETCGDAALYCEPFDVKGMGKAIEAVILDSKLRESLRSRGTERVRELSYQSCGALLWSSISELL